MPNSIQQYTKLENRLVLLAWLNDLQGYESNRQLLEETRQVAEGFDASGRSFIYHHLVARCDKVKIPHAELARYDGNIRSHLAAMNVYRAEPITLRYFQYLAALYTEIFLDYYFHRRATMLVSLNAFIAQRNRGRLPGEPQDLSFSEADLQKLAFWMATGRGAWILSGLYPMDYRRQESAPCLHRATRNDSCQRLRA